MVGKSGRLTLLRGSKTIGTKRMYTMPFDLIDFIDQISCYYVSYKALCKCVLYIIIIAYTPTYVCAYNCMYIYVYMHVVPVDEPGTTLYICTNNIIHARTLFGKSGNQQAPVEAQ